MGEVVDLESYRKLLRRREAEAKKVKRGPAPDGGKAEGSSSPLNSPTVVKRAGPSHNGPKGAAKTGGDDPKTD